MRARKAPKGAPAAAAASDGDRIGSLPDEILHRVLYFLPAQQAVQTCVLARRWLDLWKSATGLRIVGADGKSPAPFEEDREFVDTLLLLRGSSPLEKFDLGVTGPAVDVRRMRLWVRYALQCGVQELRLSIHGESPSFLRQEDPPLASRHLTNLSLQGLVVSDDFLDLSRCPVLQYLHIADCSFRYVERISSQSLKHLNITRGIFNSSSRTRIHAPNLAVLLLLVTYGRAPVLERMPLLVWADVVIWGDYCDYCSRSSNGDCGDESCTGCIQNDTSSMLLHGISQATTLNLAARAEMFIFRRDLKWCPTFSQLKTLTLNEHWCVPDAHPLACILEHSPVLVELSLFLFCKPHGFNVIMKGRFDPKELPPTISAQIKRVGVLCGVVDERVTKVLKFLSKLNISFTFLE